MRLLHVIRSADPTLGGPIEGVRLLAQAGDRMGLETDVLTFDRGNEAYVRESSYRVVAVGSGLTRYGHAPAAVRWLAAKGARYDAVIVHGLWQYAGLAVWRALRGAPVPYFVYPHGMLDPWFRKAYPIKHAKKVLYWGLVERRVLRDARAVLFTCEEERRLARRSFPAYRCREVVTGFGTAAPAGDAGSSAAAFLDTYGELAGRKLVLFLGRLHEKKGCDLLIQAFAAVTATRPEWHLVMAGPGERSYLERLQGLARRAGIAERITWTGMLRGEEKWGALRAASVFALPSHQENFGIAVAEALASGVPVAISNKVNIWREVLADGAGWVSDDTLAGTVANLNAVVAQGPAEHSAMMRRAGRCFADRFDVNRVAAGLRDLIATDGGRAVGA
jgi:glycosyltransferase involved in cell wall biosynthesis